MTGLTLCLEQHTGGKVVNSIDAPLWKLPLFVKSGAIIPMTVENHHPDDRGK